MFRSKALRMQNATAKPKHSAHVGYPQDKDVKESIQFKSCTAKLLSNIQGMNIRTNFDQQTLL